MRSPHFVLLKTITFLHFFHKKKTALDPKLLFLHVKLNGTTIVEKKVIEDVKSASCFFFLLFIADGQPQQNKNFIGEVYQGN